MAGGGYDFAASVSGSSSATSGLDQSGAFQNVFGDTIVGGKKPTPPWILAAALAGAVIILLVWLRK